MQEQHNSQLITLEKDLEKRLKNKEQIMIDKHEKVINDYKELQKVNTNLYQDNEELKKALDMLQRYFALLPPSSPICCET